MCSWPTTIPSTGKESSAPSGSDDPYLSRARAELTETLADLRNAIFELHPDVLEQAGLEAALHAVAERVSRRGGFDTVLNLSYRERHPREGLLYGAAREFLSNAAKHSQARTVSLTLAAEGPDLVLAAHDDGVGFDPRRRAYVVLPRWYGPKNNPPIPLVISPHGRGIGARANARRWGNLPALGSFAVVCPEGQGRRLRLFAWGDPGDIADLARMPRIVESALPFLRIDRRRVYAFGSSMGGQETLLLVARHPHLLAGAAAFDAATNLAARYRMFRRLPFGESLRHTLWLEVGGTPASNPLRYRLRSPLDYARRIARSGVPLQIWWSRRDRIVRNQQQESGLLYRRIRRWNPTAPVSQIIGEWDHSGDFRAITRLPSALRRFSLLPSLPSRRTIEMSSRRRTP